MCRMSVTTCYGSTRHIHWFVFVLRRKQNLAMCYARKVSPGITASAKKTQKISEEAKPSILYTIPALIIHHFVQPPLLAHKNWSFYHRITVNLIISFEWYHFCLNWCGSLCKKCFQTRTRSTNIFCVVFADAVHWAKWIAAGNYISIIAL